MTNKALVPIEEKEVVFYGDVLTAVLVKTETGQDIYVPLKPIADALGLDWPSQYRRLQRDEVLSAEAQLIVITTINSRRGNPEVISLPLKFIPGWLFGISPSRVHPELKERVLNYQRECYDVLWEAFQERRLTADVSFDDLLRSDTPAAQAYKIAAAIMKMARQQLLLEAQVETHATQLAVHEKRLEEIEATLGDPGHYITPDQAMQISQAVKTIALEIQKRTKKNEYGAVYGQMYRQFGITSYKQLPADKFDRAMAWLTEWYQRVTGATGDDLPF